MSTGRKGVNRREFVKAAGVAGAGFFIAPASAWSPRKRWRNEQIQFACVGVGGKGHSDSDDAGKFGKVVAICDIDDNTLNAAASRFPEAKKFHDFRELFDAMGDTIDAVTVSTPDHTHAIAAVRAMKLGKHCFCQKPLAHSIEEARIMGEIAREKKLATQMGNQGTASSNLRRAAAMVRNGAIGPVKEVHVWTNRAVWPQGCSRPPSKSIPGHVKWDLWLGPAPRRDFAAWNEKDAAIAKDWWGPLEAYHPFNWRGWWDFGTGALGDMACHTLNLAFMALDLRNPRSFEAEASENNRDSYPKWSKIRFEFPERNGRQPLSMWWYDGGQTPPAELLGGEEIAASGLLIVGETGSLYSMDDYGDRLKWIGSHSEPDVEFPRSPGHFAEFARAIDTGEPAISNFPDYAGPLTETVLAGNLAVWAGERVEWDAEKMEATNVSGLESLVRKPYPNGWSLD